MHTKTKHKSTIDAPASHGTTHFCKDGDWCGNGGGKNSNTPWVLGKDLPCRGVAIALWGLLYKVEGDHKPIERRGVGDGMFCSSRFGDLISSCRKSLPAGNPNCGGP